MPSRRRSGVARRSPRDRRVVRGRLVDDPHDLGAVARRRTSSRRTPRSRTGGRAPCRTSRRAAGCRTPGRSPRGTHGRGGGTRPAPSPRNCSASAGDLGPLVVVGPLGGELDDRQLEGPTRLEQLADELLAVVGAVDVTSGRCSATYERLPRRSMTPSDSRPWIASRTEVRATWNCSDSDRSDGIRAPGSSSPVVMRSSSWSRIRPLSVSRAIGSNSTAVGSATAAS